MWHNTYKGHKPDDPFTREIRGPGNGLIGCEMNELNGWGEKYHCPPARKPGLVGTLLRLLFGKETKNSQS